MLVRLQAKAGRSDGTVLFANWIDLNHFPPDSNPTPYRTEFGCKPGDVLVLYSGSIGAKQGLETLLEAAERLADRPRFRFVICGEGPGKDALAASYAHLANVAWKPLQPAERLGELLGAADVHVLPQRAGIADLVMPSKLIGMMASGRPVVATAAQDTEIWKVLQGRGVVVPPGDAQALADAIERLGASPELGARYGMAARAYVEQNLERDKVLRSFEAELAALVEQSRE
jgi:colanic acid biosynthesis glycosyl transferase WcaI